MRVGRYLDLVAAFDSSVMHDTSGGKAGQQYTPAGDWIRKRDYDSLAELKQSEKDKETQARAEQRNTVKKWAITLGIGLGISLIALIMAIFGFVRVRLAVRSRDAMYVHDIPQIGPVNVARIASIMGLAPKHGYDHRQTAATLLSLAAKGAIAIYPGPASLYGGVELTGLAAKTRPLALRAVSQMLSGSRAADLALWTSILFMPRRWACPNERCGNLPKHIRRFRTLTGWTIMPQIRWCIGTSGTPRLAIPMMARRVRAPAMALALVSVLARQTPTTWVPASAASSISARN